MLPTKVKSEEGMAAPPVHFPRGPIAGMGTWKGSVGANRVPQGHRKGHSFRCC